MAYLRNRRKLKPLKKENCEDFSRVNLAQNSNAVRSQEDYINQFSEEIGGRVANTLWKEFSRTESCNIGAVSQLDEFLLNPLKQSNSRTAPETCRNTLGTNAERKTTTPRVILRRKRASPRVRLHETLARMTLTTRSILWNWMIWRPFCKNINSSKSLENSGRVLKTQNVLNF